MDEGFEIPVTYKGKELMFPARLLQLGYTHKFEVMINDNPVLFEPDEERSYRATVDPETFAGHLDAHLLQAIASSIEEILK